MQGYTGTRYTYISRPFPTHFMVEVLKEIWVDGQITHRYVIHDAEISIDQPQSGSFEFEVPLVEDHPINLDLTSSDCPHMVIARFTNDSDERCCICDNPADFLVKSENSTLMSSYCSRHVPAPLWDSRIKQVLIRIIKQ